MPDELLTLQEPLTRAVYQRTAEGTAVIRLQGRSGEIIQQVKARATALRGGQGTDWTVMETPVAGLWSGTLQLAGGWYRVEVCGFNQAGQQVAETAVERVGVGEVILTAGQSNSCNCGQFRQKSEEDCVSAFTGKEWTHCADPQPWAHGDRGSPWPLLGDMLARRWGVAVGFCSVGVGSTSVEQWQPGGLLYPRIKHALAGLQRYGLRTVLWHQGESDSLDRTSAEDYAALLRKVIEQSRLDAGIPLPWGVAIASFHPDATREDEAKVAAGQRQVIGEASHVFAGPMTDALAGPTYRSPMDHVHFTPAGLREHARMWMDILAVEVLGETQKAATGN